MKLFNVRQRNDAPLLLNHRHVERFFRYSSMSYMPLQQNGKHQFAASQALRIYRSNAIYSFIPKNACSTLRLSIAYANGCIDNTNKFNWIHNNNHTFRADLSSLLTANYTFTILRCPYARLASVFLDKIVSRDPVAWRLYELSDRKVKLEDFTFSNFIQALKMNHIRYGEIHWRPQVDFLVYKDYDDYFNVENFAHASQTLKDKINLDVIDARPFTNHGIEKLNLIDDDFSEVSPVDIFVFKRKGMCPKPSSLYNEESIDTVTSLYEDDIKLYRKRFSSSSLMFK